MSKYFNILEKNMEFRDAQYIQERILGIPEKEIDSYIVSGINLYFIVKGMDMKKYVNQLS